MAIFSSLRSRRFATNKAEKMQSFVTFRLRDEWFGLEITSVQKVIRLGQVCGDPHKTGISLIHYQDQEILVIDVGYKIFGRASSNSLNNISLAERYLAIIQNSKGNLVGLPIDSPPAIQRVPESSIIQIPDTYLHLGNLNCISSQMIERSSEPPLFLLDPEQLSHPKKF